MAKLIVVQNDKVEGVDKHNVEGDATNPSAPPPTIPYAGVGDFDYVGKMTDQLSDFAHIDGKPIALKNSKSTLNPGEDVFPTGKHSGPMGSNFLPITPAPIPLSLSISDTIGEGNPSSTSGSSFVKVGGASVLLDGDKIDTCDGLGEPMNSTVTVENQDFVFCSE
ncbi:hypothetical protein EH223_19295 [candidate division KSB1 bacterium]|nr:hypothetical protein [candidate division KSB1 bacterium]RQW00095.1 MAG: hypothetical protein EH223_19295 [candidate division KSB1 bacterium]